MSFLITPPTQRAQTRPANSKQLYRWSTQTTAGQCSPVQTGLNVSLCVCVRECACLCLLAQAWMSALSLCLFTRLTEWRKGQSFCPACGWESKQRAEFRASYETQWALPRHWEKVDYYWFRSEGRNQVSIGTKCLFCTKIEEKTGRIVISFLFIVDV